MFKNLFNLSKKSATTNINTKNSEKITALFFINDFISTVKAMSNGTSKQNKETTYISNNTTQRLNFETNQRLFYVREEFYENTSSLFTFFRLEWYSLYTNSTILQKLGATYSQNPIFLLANSFYLKNKKITDIKQNPNNFFYKNVNNLY
jgi:hypothetical protein